MGINANDLTSHYYDFVSLALKSEAVTDEEISLINRLVTPKSSILDIGAGTGRHAITLGNQGFKVTALDSSKEMLSVLQDKDTQKQINVINKSIFNYTPSSKFDLISLFWNVFNEAALTKQKALSLLKLCKTLLNKNGRVLININNSNNIDPSKFNFETNFIQGEIKYQMLWNTYKYLPKTNTSTSKEVVNIYKNNKLIDSKTTFIKQRYWSERQITEFANEIGFNVEKLELKTSDELYLLLTLSK